MRATILKGIVNFDPRKTVIRILYLLRIINLHTLYRLSLVDRGHYAFGLMQAANDCKKLGYKGFTAIEFGVAGGNGLVALEKHAILIEKFTRVKIEVIGVDAGIGMPAPKDFKDVPYLWERGFYKMDIPLLKSRLLRSKLVIGPVHSVMPSLLEMISADRPIAFIGFDLDYYSSTMDAFAIFEGHESLFVPRVWCYFDDLPNILPFAGEYQAITEFNRKSANRKLGRPGMLIHLVPFHPSWAEQMYQLHILKHEKYNQIINSGNQLPLV